MFTGIIEATGSLLSTQRHGGDVRLHIATQALELSDVPLGDSISTNGVCLTVVLLPGDGFCADVSPETLTCTTLAHLRPGDPVNLEKSLPPLRVIPGAARARLAVRPGPNRP